MRLQAGQQSIQYGTAPDLEKGLVLTVHAGSESPAQNNGRAIGICLQARQGYYPSYAYHSVFHLIIGRTATHEGYHISCLHSKKARAQTIYLSIKVIKKKVWFNTGNSIVSFQRAW
jgi:hypothetical protein